MDSLLAVSLFDSRHNPHNPLVRFQIELPGLCLRTVEETHLDEKFVFAVIKFNTMEGRYNLALVFRFWHELKPRRLFNRGENVILWILSQLNFPNTNRQFTLGQLQINTRELRPFALTKNEVETSVPLMVHDAH